MNGNAEATTAAGAAKSLVFRGLDPGVIPWTLLGFLFLSLLLHAFGFYIFQTVYPPAAHVGPPPLQVGLLTPGTPEADAILRWIDSEDPALAAQPARAPIPGLDSLPYVPSYNSVHAPPTLAAPTSVPLPDPSGASGVDLVRMAAPQVISAPAPVAAPAETALTFSAPLQDLVTQPLPSLAPLRATGLDELRPARFLLGVSDEGKVQYVFLQDASGDKDLDTAAARLLEQVLFRKTGAPAWGFATFYWGAAIFAPAIKAEASP
jgi:hypothetical protein